MYSLSVLKELCGGDEEKVKSLLRELDNSLNEKVDLLNEALNKNDIKEVYELMHSIKSSISLVDESLGKEIIQLEKKLKKADFLKKELKVSTTKLIHKIILLKNKISQ